VIEAARRAAAAGEPPKPIAATFAQWMSPDRKTTFWTLPFTMCPSTAPGLGERRPAVVLELLGVALRGGDAVGHEHAGGDDELRSRAALRLLPGEPGEEAVELGRLAGVERGPAQQVVVGQAHVFVGVALGPRVVWPTIGPRCGSRKLLIVSPPEIG